MADIVGLLASIASLVDLSYTVVSAGKSLYDSHNDTPDELRRVSIVVEDIRQKNLPLRQIEVSGNRNLCRDERSVSILATECVEVATELENILGKLKIRDGYSKTLEATRVTFGHSWRKKEVAQKCKQLALLDSRVRENTKLIFQEQNHSATMSEIRALVQSKDDLAINLSSRFDDIQGDILRLSEISKDFKAAQLKSLQTKLENFSKDRSDWKMKTEAIRSFHFREIHRRWFGIEEADAFSNAWLFDESQTPFLLWLQGGNGMFWIGGKPGSGKSTLMKFASTHGKTKKALKRWAGPSEIHTASYFFWNQGTEMQKSKIGLIQSLLYQVLSKAPGLIPDICSDHPPHEEWEFNSLRAAFQSITEKDDMPAKFCFFIDGLDEYGGDEEDLSQVLSSLSRGSHVKFCVSSRHRPFLEERFQQKKYSLAIENFTMGDMEAHVSRTLSQNKKFGLLENSEELFKEMVATIAKHAQGVWLWVYLITRDLVKAVNHDESSAKLHEIIEAFPKDLESYFENVVKKVEPIYKREMAKIFLITLEEVQPLPLYAFSLLEKEDQNPDYAIEAPMAPITDGELLSIETPWKSRIINRCGDLLIVSPGSHPTFLRNPVDFMHRTVRDFLQDCYYQQLTNELGSLKYSPLLSLCNMTLFLLKKLNRNDLSDPQLRRDSIRRTIGLVDELLYYAHEYEVVEGNSDLVPILDEVDRVNCRHAGNLPKHWTHARDPPAARGHDVYREGNSCNYLALTVQARLVRYVKEKLQSNPTRIKKNGRPLLDYALRPRRVTPIKMPYHSDRDDPSVDVNMVQLLLDLGASPNQKVHLNDGHTVWALFLLSMYETKTRGEDKSDLTTAWYAVCDLLVQHKANLDCWLGSTFTATVVLDEVFGPEKAQKLVTQARLLHMQKAKESWSYKIRTGFGLLSPP